MPRKFRERSPRRSENVHNMARSRDPFFEVARTLGGNQDAMKRGAATAGPSNLDSLAAMLEQITLGANPTIMHPGPLAEISNPFQDAMAYMLTPDGVLAPVLPWTQEGMVTRQQFPRYHEQTELMPWQWQDAKPPQKSLTAPKGEKPKPKPKRKAK